MTEIFGAFARHAPGTPDPLVGDVPLAPPLTASVPSPMPANVDQRRHTSSPPWLSVAAWMIPSRTSVNAGLQEVFISPSFTYSIARWLPAPPPPFIKSASNPWVSTSAQYISHATCAQTDPTPCGIAIPLMLS